MRSGTFVVLRPFSTVAAVCLDAGCHRLSLPAAATVRELYSAIRHVWSGLYAVIDEATFSVLGPKSF